MPRTKKPPKPKDPRLVRGSPIHAKATAVLGSFTKAHQVYGALCKEREVNGKVIEVVQRETNKGRLMNRVIGKYQVGPRFVIKELPLSAIISGESTTFPVSAERTNALGSQRTIATFVTPSKKPPPPPPMACAPVAPTVAAPPTQMSPPSESDEDDIPLIQLVKGNKKKAADKKPPPTQDAIIVNSDDDAVDDVAAKPVPTTPPAAAKAPDDDDVPPSNAHEPIECDVTCDGTSILWTEAVPVDLLNGGHNHHDWHHKTSVKGVHICDGSDIDGALPLKYYFDAAFPVSYLSTIVKLTNEELRTSYLKPTSIMEVLKFFGILLLIPKLPPLPHKELWSTYARSQYSSAPNLGRTGMSRDRFEALFRCIRFSYQPKTKPMHMSNKAYA